MTRRAGLLVVALAATLAATTAAAPAKLAFKRVNTSLAYQPSDVAVVNADGAKGPDLAIANGNAGTVEMYLNDGSGRFPESGHTTEAACAGAREIVVGKLDAGSTDDLLVDCLSSAAATLLGDGTGGFADPVNPGLGSAAGFLELGNINGDEAVDVAFDGFVPFGEPAILCYALGAGDGTFAQPICLQDDKTLEWQGVGGGIEAADISGNAREELMTYAADGPERIAFFHYDSVAFPETGFPLTPTFRSTRATSGRVIQAADLDRDHDVDLVSGGGLGRHLSVLEGVRAGFKKAELYRTVSFADDMVLGLSGNRGRIVRYAAVLRPSPPNQQHPSDGTLAVSPADGDGGFARPKKFAAGTNGAAHQLAAGDLNRDGLFDVVSIDNASRLSLILTK